MNKKQGIKIGIDTIMVFILSLLMGYSLVGEMAHEVLGILMFILFLFHHILNAVWLKNLLRGHYTAVRICQIVVNILLLIIMVVISTSGILMSRHLFTFLPAYRGMELVRTVHLAGSYWGFVLMSFHLGLHWNKISGMMKRKMKLKTDSQIRTFFVWITAVLIALYGCYAFGKQQIDSYLFFKNQFVFFDFRQPRGIFFLQQLAMMELFALLGYCFLAGLKKIGKRKGSSYAKWNNIQRQ